jgi:hypothetical protein
MQRANYKPDTDIVEWLKQRAAAGDEQAKKILAGIERQ